MWIKMDQEQLDEMLDNLIARYKRDQLKYYAGISIIFALVSILLSFIFFYPSKFQLGAHIPGLLRAIYGFGIIFVSLELFFLVIMAFDNFRFYKKDLLPSQQSSLHIPGIHVMIGYG